MMLRRRAWTIGLAVLPAALVWRAGWLDFLFGHPGEVLRLFGQHLVLVASSGAMAIALGLGLGIAVSRPRLRPLAAPVLALAGLGQTVPSLALLALLFALIGRIGFLPAFLALTLTALLPVVRNTCLGLLTLDPAMLDAGRGMGMRGRQILWRLELPNALGVIFAGIRTALVVDVSAAALAFLIGAGGLGDLIFTGIDTQNTPILVAGVLPTTALALALDAALARMQRRLAPGGSPRIG